MFCVDFSKLVSWYWAQIWVSTKGSNFFCQNNTFSAYYGRAIKIKKFSKMFKHTGFFLFKMFSKSVHNINTFFSKKKKHLFFFVVRRRCGQRVRRGLSALLGRAIPLCGFVRCAKAGGKDGTIWQCLRGCPIQALSNVDGWVINKKANESMAHNIWP